LTEGGWNKGKWEKLYTDEIYSLYTLPKIIKTNKSRRTRWTKSVWDLFGNVNKVRILVGKPRRKNPSGRTRRRQDDNIKMKL
jgi:hypothetical protein